MSTHAGLFGRAHLERSWSASTLPIRLSAIKYQSASTYQSAYQQSSISTYNDDGAAYNKDDAVCISIAMFALSVDVIDHPDIDFMNGDLSYVSQHKDK